MIPRPSRFRFVHILVTAMLATGILASAASAQTEVAEKKTVAKDLPPAKEVLDRYLEEIGGEDAVTAFKSTHATGTFSIPAQGMNGSFDIYSAVPVKHFMKVTITGVGDMQMGYDGKVGWSVDPMSGPMIMEGKQLKQYLEQSDPHRPLYDPKDYKSMTVVDTTEFEGKTCYQVELVSDSEIETTEFFDTETGLMVGTTMKQVTPMGEVPVTTVLSEYKEFEGLRMPTLMVQKMMGMEQILTVETVAFDGVDDSVFELNPQIKALAVEKEN